MKENLKLANNGDPCQTALPFAHVSADIYREQQSKFMHVAWATVAKIKANMVLQTKKAAKVKRAFERERKRF